ncbi:hypothetical protein [Leptospira sp. severe_002]|uniref:hypothetical protein n=1 Tax=Leptospira sp. severe_002 TaxID=2838237 RepID=UPI001E3BB8A9|nr:hypothetical protein [Leptospira sp. severe_002]
MRIIALAAAATILLAPAAIPAQAHHGNAIQHQEFAMAKKKKAKAKPKMKKEMKKEEYMRAVPSR